VQTALGLDLDVFSEQMVCATSWKSSVVWAPIGEFRDSNTVFLSIRLMLI
jgi:hypothetical protein